MKINDGRFLTISLAIASLLVFSVSTLIPPTFIVNKTDSEDLKVCDFAGMWEENNLDLPQLTKWGVTFSRAQNVRIVGVLVLFISTLIIEIFIKNRKLAGVFPLYAPMRCGNGLACSHIHPFAIYALMLVKALRVSDTHQDKNGSEPS